MKKIKETSITSRATSSAENGQEIILVLDNVRSVLNVGSIFRTADAIGVSKIYLCGITPAPLDRFGRKRKDLEKTALGAENSVEWEAAAGVEKIISKLKKDGYIIISIEQDKKSIDYKKVQINNKEKYAVVLGSETDGVSKKVLSKSDIIAELKMRGEKESLNVGVTAGIVLYRFFDR